MPKGVTKYDFKAGLEYEFEILDAAGLYKDHRDLLTEPHRTNFYHIIWFREGTGTHLVDFKPVKIKKNTLLFVNRNKVQRFDMLGRYTAKIILFTDAFFCRGDTDVKFLRETILFNDLVDTSSVKLDAKDGAIPGLLQLMEAELGRHTDHYQPEILKHLLHNFLLASERQKREQGFTELKTGADLDYTLLFRDLLEERFKKVKQVASFAKEINVTEKRLNQATRNTLGLTPKEMIDERVVLEAKRLLSHTRDTIKEIGFGLGFEEPTNFIKYFRKHCHATPVEFREQYSR